MKPTKPMKSIDIEDVATLLVSDFVKQNKRCLQTRRTTQICACGYGHKSFTPFLKMPFARRKKLVVQTLDKLMEH